MNADLTFNSIAFKKQYDLENKSSRRSITRGINTPDDLIIQSMTTINSKTKVPEQRINYRVDRHTIDASLQKIITSGLVTFAVPETAVQADIDAVVATLKAVVADADFTANVLAGQK